MTIENTETQEYSRDVSGNWPLERLLSEVVGSGPKSAENMTGTQAREALVRIFDGEPDPTTLGAFFLANRWKRNTPDELAGYVDVMRDRSVETVKPSVDPVDCGANYDGKTGITLLGVAAGIVAAAAGTPVVVHSGDRVPVDRATAYKHVLDELDVETDLTPGESADMVDDTGFGFYYQPQFNPAVHALLDRRRAMGVRTFVNTIETLANPAGATVHLGSFYHLSFGKKLAETIEASESLAFERALFFQGLEGYDDVRPGQTTVAEWTGGDLDDYEIRTGAYGMELTESDLEVEHVASDSAQVTRTVLNGEGEGQFADAVALNAALRMYAGGTVNSIEAGVDAARDAIADGSAAAVLEDVRAFSP